MPTIETMNMCCGVGTETGITGNAESLTLRGVNLGDRLWKYNPIYNELLINIFLMNEKNIIDVIVRKIENFNPEFGHGYPSAWTRLSKLIQGRRIRIQLRGVSFVSENFTEEQRKLVEETFSCRITSFYGHSERAGFAAEIPENKGIYYVFPTYGLIEVLDEHGRRVPEGGFGEVTCTTFINKALPLIRYRTGDFARVHRATSSGIPMSLTEISGRWGKDFVYDKYGNRISMTLVNVHSFAQYNFKYIQFRQDTPGKLSVYLVPFEKLKKRDFEDLKREFIEKLKNFDIDFLICDESQIVFSIRGKVPYLVSTLSEEEKS
ncbi:phenylacetate--CoA ligase family protein [Caldicoprobacter faecalis]|nr:hypothetical protein [Caldicoprobacter faecalis]